MTRPFPAFISIGMLFGARTCSATYFQDQRVFRPCDADQLVGQYPQWPIRQACAAQNLGIAGKLVSIAA